MKKFLRVFFAVMFFVSLCGLFACNNDYLIGTWKFTNVDVYINNELYSYKISDLQLHESESDFENLTNEEKAKRYAEECSNGYENITVTFNSDYVIFSSSQDEYNWVRNDDNVIITQQGKIINEWKISSNNNEKTFNLIFEIQINDDTIIDLILTK